MLAAATGSLCTEQVTTVITSFRSPSACEKPRFVRFGSPPGDDLLARQPEAAGDFRDQPILRGNVVERAAVTIDLLVDVGPALDDPPGVVVDDVRKQQVSFGVEPELDLEVDERPPFELPCLLPARGRPGVRCAASREDFPLLVAAEHVGGRKHRNGSWPWIGFAGLNSRICEAPSV